jgi:hypothetical protein
VIHAQLEQLQALQAEGVGIDPAVGTRLLARAEKEGRSASSSSPETSADLIPTLVIVNVNSGAARSYAWQA